MDHWFALRQHPGPRGTFLLYQHAEDTASTLLSQEGKGKQGGHCIMHHVRGGPVSQLPEAQLDLPEDSHQEALRVHEGGLPGHR